MTPNSKRPPALAPAAGPPGALDCGVDGTVLGPAPFEQATRTAAPAASTTARKRRWRAPIRQTVGDHRPVATLARVLATLASAAAGYLIGTVPCADGAARLASGGATHPRGPRPREPGAGEALAPARKAWGRGNPPPPAAQGGPA